MDGISMMTGLIVLTLGAAVGIGVWQYARVRTSQRKHGEQPGEARLNVAKIDARKEEFADRPNP